MSSSAPRPLRVRWLGRVSYEEAHALQRSLFEADEDWLLLLEHPHVFTAGPRTAPENVLVAPASVGVELVRTDRGGDVTYHGPGQLVGYPVMSVPGRRGGGMADTAAYVHSVEGVIIQVLEDLGLPGTGRLPEHPGVWVEPNGSRPRKIAAIGVRLGRGRSMHGFALNVDPDMSYFEKIVPCGIPDKGVTSLDAEGVGASMADVVELIATRAAEVFAPGRQVDRQDVSRAMRGDLRLAASAEPGGLEVGSDRAAPARKPSWVRAPVRMGEGYLRLKRTMRDLNLVTVCEEAGCPNIFECWSEGTATFMINGERCTRACGFCLVDTRKPLDLDREEPVRVARAVEQMGLRFAVVTGVARDDLPDGGAGAFAETVAAIRRLCPGVSVEVLVPDFKGRAEPLARVLEAGPDIFNHNVETVPRLQRRARPSAGYARSLGVLARAKQAGATTKSGLVLGMGETTEEVLGTLADLAGVGVDIATVGQYLQPTAAHLPVERWWTPGELEELKVAGEALGIAHVEASPLTRSSYHAAGAAAAASAS